MQGQTLLTTPVVKLGMKERGNLLAKRKQRQKGKGKSAYVAKALFGLAGAAQVTVGQPMLYFASVASICDDTISYRTNTDQDCATNLVEDYQEDDSLFYWELPSWAGLIAGGNFRHRPAFGILRDKDQKSLSLKVRFPPAIISNAKSREDREMPWDYQWRNNLTRYNPKLVMKPSATR